MFLPRFFPKLRETIKDARGLVREVRQAKRDDGVIDAEEAAEIVKDSLELAQDVLGEVTLSEDAKNLALALCEEMIRRLGFGPRVRAKMACTRKDGHQVELLPDYTSEVNKAWSDATPAAYVEMTIANPPALDFFEPGEEYFLDFSRAPKE